MNNNNMENKVTSIEELIQASRGAIVELPPFSEEHRFFARLKRPSMLKLVKANKIPNELLTSANSLFTQGTRSLNTLDKTMMNNLFGVMDIICEEAFVEPSYRELKEAGVELTDDQIAFIFGYTQNGVKQLESFRQ